MRISSYHIAFILVIFSGCAKSIAPLGSAQPASPQKVESGIRVLCYNIHHANPPSKSNFIDIPAIASVIKTQNPDLVALQEVDVFTDRSGKSVHQAEELARLTGMKAYFAKAIDYAGGEYGVAILSRYPMEQTQKFNLPTLNGTNGEPRILATAIIILPGNRKILFASTHLDAQRSDINRVLQIRQIDSILSSEKLPVIIAGDFNAEPSSTVVTILDRRFSRTCKTDCGFTIPQLNPRKTIDFIAFAPINAFTVSEHKVIQEPYASDHLPVFSVLHLK